ncbi:hypothetical protein AB0D10_03075 [Kitasatospora sp. NPDC048545]|uniref:hypothetical protein n=1 Tax=Kitasatospora sp. NPDC048545 TaxID=3157208 RepID=UPI0033C6B5DD
MRKRRSGTAGLVAAVTAGCAVAVLGSGPSWALQQRPEPRPAVDVAAPDTSGVSTLPALVPAPGAPEASTLPAVVAAPSHSHLEVVRLDPGPAVPGGTTTIHAFVANYGPDTTASPFTVTVTLPEGVTAEGPYFPEDCQVVALGRQVRCVFGPGLKEGRSATALVPVRLSPAVPLGLLEGGSVAVRSADDPFGKNHRQPYEIKVVETSGDS